MLIVYGGLLYLTYYGFTRTPTGFIPPQDKGYLLVNVQLPDAASLERTEEVMRADRGDRRATTPGVKHTVGHRRASRSCSTPTPRTSARCT